VRIERDGHRASDYQVRFESVELDGGAAARVCQRAWTASPTRPSPGSTRPRRTAPR